MPLRAMVRKDLQLFFSDRRAVIMSFGMPIAIASFFGSIFSGPSHERARIAVAIVDQDWVPTFVFPAWLQQLTVVVPARWAVDGLDAITWRGIGWQGAVMPTLILLGFAAVFGAIALLRFRREEA